jgi:D-amino-acid oxidase
MHRRTWLRTVALAAMGAQAARCGLRSPRGSASGAAFHLPSPNVSWDRIIRTVVGLRPFRASGFRVEAERFDGKVVVHNYGHGGGGVSLSWGTAQLAADEVIPTGERRCAVIGCGAVGLATARTLQRRGMDVTIYAQGVPPDTTSSVAPAGFTPGSRVVDQSRRTPEFEARFARAAELSYRAWQLLVGDYYGVRWLYDYSAEDQLGAPTQTSRLLEALRTETVVFKEGQHPFPSRFVTRRANLMIETPVYLAATLRDFLLWGGKIVVRKFESVKDVVALSEPVVMNCTGLGSRELFGDEDLTPVKGQLTVLIPQPEIDYTMSGGAGLYMMPRRDGILLGGTAERDVWTLEPNEEARRRVVEGHINFFGRMRPGGAAVKSSGPSHPVTRVDEIPRDAWLATLGDDGF